MKGLKIRIALAHIFPFKGLALIRPIFKKSERIAIPTGNFEIGANGEMIEIRDPAHIIMDKWFCRMRPKRLCLKPVETHHLVRGKPSKIHDMGWVGLGHSLVRKIDIGKIAIFHGPEHIAPSDVESFDADICIREPGLKAAQRRRAIGQNRVMTAIFIVDLPGLNIWVLIIALCHDLGDANTFFQITLMRKTIMPAGSKFTRRPVFVMSEHIRMFMGHPARRRGCRRSQNNFQSRASQRFNGVVQPLPVKPARLWLHPAPCKFANADP